MVQQSHSQTSMDSMLTHEEPSLAHWAITDMYEEAHDPMWQMHTPPPMTQESDEEADGIEAEWTPEWKGVRQVMADCVTWETSYLDRNSPEYDPYD